MGSSRPFPRSFSRSLYLYLSHSTSSILSLRLLLFPNDVALWNVARCTLTHSDARTPCTPAVWGYQRAPNATSRLSPRQLCVRTCVVLWSGVWCAQLRVIIWWWMRDGKTGGLRSSGHAARPQPAKPAPCSWGRQSTEDLRRNPVVLRHSQTSTKHCVDRKPRPPKKHSCAESEWIRE